MKTILKVIVVLACLNLSSSFLKAQEATKPVKNDGRKIIAIDEVIEDSFGPDTPKTRGWNMNKYRFAGKKGEPLTIMIESDFAEGDNSRIYVWLSRDEGIDVQLGGNYERRKAAATWSTILQKDGEYLLNAYPMKREFQGKYRFVIARGGKDQAAALLNGGAPSALSASAGAAAGTATVAGTATAVTGRSNEFKEGIPAFPKMPEHPDLPEATAAFKLYSDFTSSSWTANSKLQSPGTLEKNFKVKGSFFCESASGSAEVTFGVDKSKPAVAQIRLMRLQDSTCGKPVQAFIVYANGDFWLGTVKLEKGYLTPQAVDGLLARSNGEAAYGTMLNDGRLKVAFLTDPNGVALKRLDPNIPLDGIAPYRLIIPLVGQVDGEANNLNLVPLTAGSFKTFDGTYKTSGPISVFEVNGSNAQRAQETAILFRFTNGEPAKHPVLAMRLEGLTRIETTQATGLGPAGVYLFHGVLKPGLLPLAEEVQPAPGTLAKYATDSEACAMKPAIPVSWLLWAPECKAKPDTMQAWSVDGRYRLTFKKLGQTVLEMFDPSRPGQPLAEWRAASFTTDKVPAPKGPTEMWRDDALAFKGPFQGLQPNGAGLCGIPGEENKTEKCVYENGERVDAIYLARLEQAKLDAEFAQRISESENNRRAAAEQRAQRAREAAEQKRQVELAQARERQQKKSALFGALLGAGLQSMASTSALNSYSSGSSFQNPLQTLVDTTMQQTMGTNLTTMATDPARATMQIVQHGVEESARKAQQNAATSQAAIAPVTQPQSTSAAAFSAPARGSAAAPSSNLIDGTYATADTAYQIEVKLSGNTLTVIEPNKTSQYTQTGLGRFEFRNPTNGILYGLQIVNNKTLMAFKPPTNPSTGTQLNLIRAAAQSSGGACKAESLTVAGQKIYGLRELIDPQHGKVKVDGHYRYIDHASGMPDIMLTNGSGSYFNAHGAGPGTGERHDIKNWWIQANCDGTPINEGKTDVGVKYVLIFEYTSPYQGNIFDLAQLGISWTQQKMYIFGERAKGLSE